MASLISPVAIKGRICCSREVSQSVSHEAEQGDRATDAELNVPKSLTEGEILSGIACVREDALAVVEVHEQLRRHRAGRIPRTMVAPRLEHREPVGGADRRTRRPSPVSRREGSARDSRARRTGRAQMAGLRSALISGLLRGPVSVGYFVWGLAVGGQGVSRPPLGTSNHSTMRVMMPAPTVLLPSRMAKRDFSSIAIGLCSSTVSSALSPGSTISAPSLSPTVPVTSVVRK